MSATCFDLTVIIRREVLPCVNVCSQLIYSLLELSRIVEAIVNLRLEVSLEEILLLKGASI